MAPNRVNNPDKPVDAEIHHSEMRELGPLPYGCSVQAQIAGPAILCVFDGACGSCLACCVSRGRALYCPPASSQPIWVPVPKQNTDDDLPNASNTVGVIEGLGVVVVVFPRLFVMRYVVRKLCRLHLDILTLYFIN